MVPYRLAAVWNLKTLVNIPVLLKSISLSYTLNDGSFKYFVRSTNNLETTGLVSYPDLPNADTFHIQYQNHQ